MASDGDGPAAGGNVYAMAGPGGGKGTGGSAVYDTALAAAANEPSRPGVGAVDESCMDDIATLNRQMDDLGFDFSDDEISDDSTSSADAGPTQQFHNRRGILKKVQCRTSVYSLHPFY